MYWDSSADLRSTSADSSSASAAGCRDAPDQKACQRSGRLRLRLRSLTTAALEIARLSRSSAASCVAVDARVFTGLDQQSRLLALISW